MVPGALLWEMLQGARPFAGLTQSQVLHAVAEGKILEVPGDAPEVLRPLLAGCLHRRPEARWVLFGWSGGPLTHIRVGCRLFCCGAHRLLACWPEGGERREDQGKRASKGATQALKREKRGRSVCDSTSECVCVCVRTLVWLHHLLFAAAIPERSHVSEGPAQNLPCLIAGQGFQRCWRNWRRSNASSVGDWALVGWITNP